METIIVGLIIILVVGFFGAKLINRLSMNKQIRFQKNNINTANLSGNVFFYFDGHIFSSQIGFCILRIDNKKPIKVFPGMPLGLEINTGIHTISATYPRQGNEIYPARIQVEVKPNIRYQIVYTFPVTKLTPSQLSIKIIHGN